ncbi:hypothetical protein VW23_018315 [Devosia insulae DS-56]|uniref:L-rhamnose mutarotase n=1 Tax=Devosia insulae DS-56 TaxID=1116389 RepID=A0A1E5XR41_9HYPH|nr:hypothetical protein [Devosia insulae]OEO31043.1 hypothetical protein VW23_018315 [Devosia insulae DS-56]
MAYMMSAAFPVRPGKEDRVRNFEKELAPHRAEWDRLCREAGDFKFFSVTLQETPMGNLMIQSFVFNDPTKVRQVFTSSAHDSWWTEWVKDVTGLDITGPNVPQPPMPAFVWQG